VPRSWSLFLARLRSLQGSLFQRLPNDTVRLMYSPYPHIDKICYAVHYRSCSLNIYPPFFGRPWLSLYPVNRFDHAVDCLQPREPHRSRPRPYYPSSSRRYSRNHVQRLSNPRTGAVAFANPLLNRHPSGVIPNGGIAEHSPHRHPSIRIPFRQTLADSLSPHRLSRSPQNQRYTYM
jgi:hypothetical protein